MIADLLPDEVVAVETVDELDDVELSAGEIAALGNAVERRRREFVTGRACARRALERTGVGPVPVAAGPRGEPLWPDGIVGSITHCRGYRACAVARADQVASVGIDAEPHEPLRDGVLESIASPTERRRLGTREGSGVCLDKVLFSAKEAVYKAWFPLTRKWLDFDEVDMSLDARDETFRARLLVPGPVVAGRRIDEFRGRWRATGDVVLTAAVVRP